MSSIHAPQDVGRRVRFTQATLVFQIPRAALRASAQRLTMLPNRRTLLHLYFFGV